MRIVLFLAILLTGLFCFPIHAREGKVFLSDTRWWKGDIRFQKNSQGEEEVLVLFKSGGSFIVPRSQVKNIVYPSMNTRAVSRLNGRDVVFHEALRNTASQVHRSRVPILYEPYIKIASGKSRLDPNLVKAVIKQESNFKRQDVSNKGAQGLMQLMPDTAKKLGVNDSLDPWENINGGTRYLRYMLETFHGDLALALAAYNAGPGAVMKYGKIPPYRETRDYVKRVMGYYHMYRDTPLISYEDNRGALVITDRPYLANQP